MDVGDGAKDEQAALWNGLAGRGWVEAQGALDQMFKPFDDLLAETIPAGSEIRVLDIGCGTGSTALAVARRLGPAGGCMGVDISEPMIAAARARAMSGGISARFVRADAETYPFEPERFDLVMSRMGVMFFQDPVRAFLNIRAAARAGAGLRFVAWRGPEENPFMTAAEHAAAPLLPDRFKGRAARRPDAPGQFAFADRRRVCSILEDSGWSDIDIQPIDIDCRFAEKELVRYLTWMGPVGRILQEADQRTRARVVESVRAAFDPYVQGMDVCFTAACWMVSARAATGEAAHA